MRRASRTPRARRSGGLLASVAVGVAWCCAACGDGGTSAAPDQIRMTVGSGGRLTIARFPPFRYDGEGSGGVGRVTSLAGGVAGVRFEGDELAIPPLPIVGDAVRIDITTGSLEGTVDFCGGEIHLAFDAAFRPVLLGRPYPTAISVVTDLTSETAAGELTRYTGSRLGEDGVAFLVGVARVPVTDDGFVDALLSLPTDAVAELPVTLEALPERPRCER